MIVIKKNSVNMLPMLQMFARRCRSIFQSLKNTLTLKHRLSMSVLETNDYCLINKSKLHPLLVTEFQ
jgi:hypothetical protein